MINPVKIPFSFCRIQRAAEFLGVSTDDLLSLAVSNKITLCIRLDGLNSILFVDGNVSSLTDWYLSLSANRCDRAFSHNLSKYTSFSIDRFSYDEENDEPVFHPWFYDSPKTNGASGESAVSHKGRAFGLWVPQLPVINSVLNYGKSSILWGALGLYCTDESTPSLCLIPLALNHDELCDSNDEGCEEIFPDIEITVDDLWITSEQVRELLKYNGDYSELPNCAQCGVFASPETVREMRKVNHIAEHHAVNREKLFKSAIYLLSRYPDECRGERKEISPEKWRDCIVSHKEEIPPLIITNEDVILKHLRAAANGKG